LNNPQSKIRNRQPATNNPLAPYPDSM
jgi:hypothetical protein